MSMNIIKKYYVYQVVFFKTNEINYISKIIKNCCQKKKLYKRVNIIAEIGVNHNGNISIAKKLIKIAKNCGADYAKFQIYNASD